MTALLLKALRTNPRRTISRSSLDALVDRGDHHHRPGVLGDGRNNKKRTGSEITPLSNSMLFIFVDTIAACMHMQSLIMRAGPILLYDETLAS